MATVENAKRKAMLEDRETFGTVLLAILLDSYGTNMFEWEPESLTQQIWDDFNAKMPPINRDKVWSLIVAMTSNQFYLNIEVFKATCDALSNEDPDFSTFNPSDPEELAWGVTEVLLNDPPDEKLGNTEFSHEIEYYVGLILKENGVLQPPVQLSFAQYGQENPVTALETVFADDPVLFQAAHENQLRLKAAVEEYVQLRLQALITQLNSAPLRNRQPAQASS